jgi:transposase
VLIDHTNRRVIDVLESRDKATVVAWLTANKPGLLSHLQGITCDMWDGYAEAAKEVFGDTVHVTIDRTLSVVEGHVMKNFQDRLSECRRQLQNQLPAEQKKELPFDCAQGEGSRWLWVTNPENLKPEQRAELDKHKRRFPELAALHDHRERLRQIFEDRRLTDPAKAAERLRAWAEHGRSLGLTALAKFNKTLENWMDGIANYFVTRSSNGRTEGFNRGLRAVLWRACGMTNFAHFRLRVLHAFG